MSALGGMLGLNGGINGTGVQGPASINVGNGTNGAQLQSSYNGVQDSLASQQNLLRALQAQNGLGNQSQVYNQLQGVANGTGPNPALAQLNQSTGQNIANQAALMASQRGVSSNAGLLARQAAQQGAGIQQNAAGQAATLQAQQSLNALGQAGNIANTQAANQIGAVGANTQAQQGEQQILQNALAQENQGKVAMQGNINNANAGLAGGVMQGQQGLVGGLLSAGGAAMGGKHAQGGTIGYAEGGDVNSPQSFLGKFAAGMGDSFSGTAGGNPGAQALQKGMASFGSGIGSLLASKPSAPGPDDWFGTAGHHAQGGNVGSKLKSGGGVPGKAKVAGNSLKNDTVKALLSPGEGVIDRETMSHPGAVGDAARFVMAYVNKKKAQK